MHAALPDPNALCLAHAAAAPRLLLAALLAVATAGCSADSGDRSREDRIAPVEVAAITRGPISQRGRFSGSLEARAQFTVAARVAGRVRRVTADIGETVRRGEVVVELDGDEHRQALAEAEAERAVARSGLAVAKSALDTAARELERVQRLRERKVISEAEAEVAQANHEARLAEVAAAEARITKAVASREAAAIRLGYVRLKADWDGEDGERVVGERFVEPGDTVAANAPLLTVVDLDPITAVIFVAERDYRFLTPGLAATFTADAYPAERFSGEVQRVAPVFQQGSRQARVELTVANSDGRLKPGMFVQAEVILREVAEADVVPASALTRRGDQPGLFLVSDDGTRVTWRQVSVGVRDGERLQVIGEGLAGRVVTLGQQLLTDGGRITIPEPEPAEPTAAESR